MCERKARQHKVIDFVSVAVLLLILTGVRGQNAAAQARQGGQPLPASPKASAPMDLTGYWVSVVTEDWRFRMVTPPKGDYASVPMTAEARKVADTWEPSKDGSCLAYGAGGLMRIPTRLHITWESETVLKVETDAGMQLRRFVFNASERPVRHSLQGFSAATWERPGRGERTAGGGGDLKVVTTNMSGGWVRKNGVPYSENALMTEYIDRFTGPQADEWFTVTTIIEDAKFFTQPFVTSTHFKKERDGSKWSPSPCRATT